MEYIVPSHRRMNLLVMAICYIGTPPHLLDGLVVPEGLNIDFLYDSMHMNTPNTRLYYQTVSR